MKGKQHWTPFLKMGKWRAMEKFGLVHADLCGPISPTSSDHKKYLLCFIDEFSRKTWSKHFIISNVPKQWWKKKVECL